MNIANKDARIVAITNLACTCIGMRYDLHKYFISNGYTVVAQLDSADYIVVVTCGVVVESEKLCVDAVQHILDKKKPSAKVVLMGCLPLINGEIFYGMSDVVLAYSPEDVDRLFRSQMKLSATGSYNLLKDCYEENCNCLNSLIKEILSNTLQAYVRVRFVSDAIANLVYFMRTKMSNNQFFKNRKNKTYYIIPCFGCSNFCTYCATRKAIGPVKSRSIDQVLVELDEGYNKGYRKFALIAASLCCYGADLELDLIDLLNKVTSYRYDFDLGLYVIHPGWLINNFEFFLRIMNKKRVFELCIAVESGSQSVLNRMNRKYSIDRLKYCLNEIKSLYPDVAIFFQMMVGFPGETEDEFQETMMFLKAIDFSYIEISGYSQRPGVPARLMPGQVPADVIQTRKMKVIKEFRSVLIRYYIKAFFPAALFARKASPPGIKARRESMSV